MPWLGRLRQPTLVLAGNDDLIVPLVNGRILARRIPCARLHVVPGGGHLFLLERPAELTALVADYLRGAELHKDGAIADLPTLETIAGRVPGHVRRPRPDDGGVRPHGRNAVPAFDVVLRPTKTVSILYGLGGPATGRAVLAAHHPGMAEAVASFDPHLAPPAAGPRRRRAGAQAHRAVVTVL